MRVHDAAAPVPTTSRGRRCTHEMVSLLSPCNHCMIQGTLMVSPHPFRLKEKKTMAGAEHEQRIVKGASCLYVCTFELFGSRTLCEQPR